MDIHKPLLTCSIFYNVPLYNCVISNYVHNRTLLCIVIVLDAVSYEMILCAFVLSS